MGPLQKLKKYTNDEKTKETLVIIIKQTRTRRKEKEEGKKKYNLG